MRLLQMTEVAGGPGSGGVPTTASIVKEGWLFKRGEFCQYTVSVFANAACSLEESEQSQCTLFYNSYQHLGYALDNGGFARARVCNSLNSFLCFNVQELRLARRFY
jgi:hypothetical protein